MRLLPLFVLALGCGSGADDSGPCPAGQIQADPDGRGVRCISGASDCTDRLACGDPTVQVDCCKPYCGDPDADLRFTCESSCLVPDCTSSVKCAAAERCETYNECSASCVPDQPCEAGMVMANPDGTGFRCVPSDSDCFRPIDCGPSANPQCCERSCTEGADGRFACEEVCEPGTVGAGAGIAYRQQCYHDEDCASWYGAANWTCNGCPGDCVWEAECEIDADCVIQTDTRNCCACPAAVGAAIAEREECIVGPDEVPPPECLPDACDASLCPDCPVVTGATCSYGDCMEVSG